jgi:hypothetical protein
MMMFSGSSWSPLMLKSCLLIALALLGACASSPTQTTAAGASCMDGTTREGFLDSMPLGDAPCARALQTCVNGRWAGPMLHEQCSSSSKSCEGTPHGTIVTGYLAPFAHLGGCVTGSKTCVDGAWVGPVIHQSCQETN